MGEGEKGIGLEGMSSSWGRARGWGEGGGSEKVWKRGGGGGCKKTPKDMAYFSTLAVKIFFQRRAGKEERDADGCEGGSDSGRRCSKESIERR